MNDTITAISTTLGIGAISMIRLSGTNAIAIADSVFSGNLKNKGTHTVNYGHIIQNTKVIDEVLVTIMKSPRTYTKEDVVEISCHGGIITTNKVLEVLIENGARLAEPGEFTKRAFLNGRIDLGQAEGIIDLIEARTDKAREVAIKRLDGNVSRLIKSLRNEIVEILANIEVNIDYPEYEDAIEVTNQIIKEKTDEFEKQIVEIIKEAEDTKIIRDGIKTAIIGKPNVGKSSLLNMLLKEERAIVTNIPGTTRDTIDGNILINGIMLNIIDTAGIRNTEDEVETIGVNKSLKLIEEAELLIVVLDNNNELDKEDRLILEKTKSKNVIKVINKNDLDTKINKSELDDYIEISALNKDGIHIIKEKISEIYNLEKLKNNELSYVINARELGLLKQILKLISDINIGINNEIPVDMIEIDLKKIWDILGEIIGESYSEELIDQLFTNFCLGK